VKRLKDIPDRSNGWHGQRLRERAATAGVTMAELWQSDTVGAAALSVPAKAEKIGPKGVTYRFTDGSTAVILLKWP